MYTTQHEATGGPACPPRLPDLVEIHEEDISLAPTLIDGRPSSFHLVQLQYGALIYLKPKQSFNKWTWGH